MVFLENVIPPDLRRRRKLKVTIRVCVCGVQSDRVNTQTRQYGRPGDDCGGERSNERTNERVNEERSRWSVALAFVSEERVFEVAATVAVVRARVSKRNESGNTGIRRSFVPDESVLGGRRTRPEAAAVARQFEISSYKHTVRNA